MGKSKSIWKKKFIPYESDMKTNVYTDILHIMEIDWFSLYLIITLSVCVFPTRFFGKITEKIWVWNKKEPRLQCNYRDHTNERDTFIEMILSESIVNCGLWIELVQNKTATKKIKFKIYLTKLDRFFTHFYVRWCNIHVYRA